MMVNFYLLLDEVKDLKLDGSVSKINDLSVSFAELKNYGFVVEAPQSVMSKVLSLKDVRAKKVDVEKNIGSIPILPTTGLITSSGPIISGTSEFMWGS